MTQEKRAVRFEVRASSDEDFALTGQSVVFNDETLIGGEQDGFLERVLPGALDGSLAPEKEIKCLFNHNPDTVLGSRKSGTLALKSTNSGLIFACSLDKSNAKHREVYAMTKRGDLSGCSFGFYPEDEDWDEARDKSGKVRARRTLKRVNMFEMSIVTFPAYQSTMVQARSVDFSAQVQRVLANPNGLAAMDAAYRKKAREIEYEILRAAPAFIIRDGVVFPDFRSEDERNRERAEQLGEQIAQDTLREVREDFIN